LNVRPDHLRPQDYYALPVQNLRTYPVYVPGREPAGYWEMLQHATPKPLIEPSALPTVADWISAGQRVFDELDHFGLRTMDPRWIAAARSAETFDPARTTILPDGAVFGLRWVPTEQGVALSFSNCSACHVAHLADGTQIVGAPTLAGRQNGPTPLLLAVHQANRLIPSAIPFRMGDEPFGMRLYRAFGVPWARDEEQNNRLKAMVASDLPAWIAADARGGAIPRWNGSIFYPAKVPDLIGIRDRRYVDATATHLHRGIADLMRYAALVSTAEPAAIGGFPLLPADAHRIEARLPDEALYALALYLYSLKPPPNPNPFNDSARAGEKVFTREGCPRCHTPPLYTNNKVTLAQGFTPPADVPAALDVLRVSIGTDPGLALKTRKGTGYYKVPSLRGVWYRGHYLHDGSAASLEEMFDPDRLKDTHIPGGFTPPGTTTRAIPGHPFGLQLGPDERTQLIAFLRTL
jgi:cytochrome c2